MRGEERRLSLLYILKREESKKVVSHLLLFILNTYPAVGG
jgi:hypothetical protein